MSWQPIETAPKDGTLILVYFPDFHAAHEVSWVAPKGAKEDERTWCIDDGKHGPFAFLPWSTNPTHWMPMPAPPSEGDTPTPPGVDTQATVSVEAYEQLRKEVTEMAQESVRRELALARLEVHVESMRGAYAQLENEVSE